MSTIDWIVLATTLLFIVVYGIYRSRGSKNIHDYLLANQSMPWYSVGISVMATQASAITFLSAPGQAFTDGMRFVQFYFGLPLAMVVLCVTFIPIYHRLKIYTAYEYLEGRFDLKTRVFTAILFLIQRGLAAGLTIYAPAIILSTLLNWDVNYTIFFIGGLVVLYTVSGGTKAVAYTQMQQMAIIFIGMFLAGFMVVKMLPEEISFGNAITIAGDLGKMNVLDLNFDLTNRYNIWSGLIGGFFLALSYFGTDQSQVGRYLSGKSITESRLGLVMNGMLKIPMQFFILLIGILVFVFYQFQQAPVNFNSSELKKVKSSIYADDVLQLEKKHQDIQLKNQEEVKLLAKAIRQDETEKREVAKNNVKAYQKEMAGIRTDVQLLMTKNDKKANINDTNYIFLTFVTKFLPVGLIGLLIAVVFSASMSSTAGELNSLASTSVIDIYKRLFKKDGNDAHYLWASRLFTIIWGAYAIFVAQFANRMGSLIEAVNILGSLFYGTILGIFLVGFYFKTIKSNAVFYGAIAAELCVLFIYWLDLVAFLWLNLIGCLLVITFAWGFERFTKKSS